MQIILCGTFQFENKMIYWPTGEAAVLEAPGPAHLPRGQCVRCEVSSFSVDVSIRVRVCPWLHMVISSSKMPLIVAF